MKTITFKGASIWAIGTSHVITIPKAYVDNGLITDDQEYTVSMTVQEKQ